MGSPDYGVELIWHGHSCFTLRDSLGRTLVFDPFDETIGYGRLELRADAFLITHDHFDHNHRRAVKTRIGPLDIVDRAGLSNVANGVPVLGIASAHDEEDGQINGQNIIYAFTLGGLRFVNLGDIGQRALTPEQIKQMGQVDVLFIPVGGFVTIDARQAKMLVDELRPGIVIPIHYGESRFYHLAAVSLFTGMFAPEEVRALETESVRLRRADVAPSHPVIYTFVPTTRNY